MYKSINFLINDFNNCNDIIKSVKNIQQNLFHDILTNTSFTSIDDCRVHSYSVDHEDVPNEIFYLNEQGEDVHYECLYLVLECVFYNGCLLVVEQESNDDLRLLVLDPLKKKVIREEDD